MRLRFPAVLALAVGSVSAASAWEQPPTPGPSPAFAKATASKKRLEVPAEQAKLGSVYHAVCGKDRQVFFTSNAEFEKIEGQSNGVIGYAVAGPADNPAQLKAGEWHLPVASMRTGMKARDEHLTQETWLDGAKHPDIVFTLKEVRDIAPAAAEKPGAKTYTCTLVGTFFIRGVTQNATLPNSTIVFLPASGETAAQAKGDLMAVRAKYKAELAKFGVRNEAVTKRKKVAEVIDIDISLILANGPE